MRRSHAPSRPRDNNSECPSSGNYAEYQAIHIKQGVDRVLRAGSTLHGAAIALFACHSLFSKVSWSTTSILIVCWSSLVGLMRMAKPALKQWMAQHPTLVGIALQHSIFFVFCTCITVTALRMPTEVEQHRVFLTGLLSAVTLFTAHGYAPFQANAVLFTITFTHHWIWFHYAVGFLKVPAMLYGAIAVCYQLNIFHRMDASAQQAFQSTWELEQDREYLQKMQETLHRMLSSLFDASCVLDQHARILSCTPQLEMLLGRTRADSIASGNVCDFVASASEGERFSNFLQSVASKSSQTAETIQLTLSCSSPEQVQTDVKLYSITLPCHSRDSGHPEDKQIFVGFQHEEQTSSPSVADRRARQHAASTIVEEEGACNELVEDAEHMLEESRDFFDSLTDGGSLTYSISEMSRSTSKQAAKSVKSSVSSVSRSTHQSNHRLMCQDAATQTTEGNSALPLILPNRPPRLPQVKTSSRSHTKRRVILNTSRRVLPQFAETPKAVAKQILLECMMHINPCGLGCCPLHVCTASLSRVMQDMCSESCNQTFELLADWQCLCCAALNQFSDEGDEDEDVYVCEVCAGESPAGAQATGSSACQSSEGGKP